MPKHPKRQAAFPNAHKISKVYHANNTDQQLNDFLSQLKVERIKGILNADKGWFIINGIGGMFQLHLQTIAELKLLPVKITCRVFRLH